MVDLILRNRTATPTSSTVLPMFHTFTTALQYTPSPSYLHAHQEIHRRHPLMAQSYASTKLPMPSSLSLCSPMLMPIHEMPEHLHSISLLPSPPQWFFESQAYSSKLRLLLDRANLELRRILLQNILVMILRTLLVSKTIFSSHHFSGSPSTNSPFPHLPFLPKLHKKRGKKTYLPKLLTSILPPHPLQDLGSSRVLVDEGCEAVHGAVDDDI